MLIMCFIAMAMKHMINMYYLFMIAGLNQVWEYFKHEFLDMKSRRSIVGGFLSYKTRGYWPLLLRMWLGFMWFVEGANKVKEGWLNFSDGQSRSGWLFSSGVVQAGIKAAEATSAASGAAAETAVAATSAASAAAGWVEPTTAAAGAASGLWFDPTAIIFKADGGVATWFRTTFMDGIMAYLPYTILQAGIVSAEIAIGLALFGGFFTWVAAAASCAMCIVFTLSGMFSWDRLWFFFAGILMLGGAGRAFGMDYWFVPLVKRWWNGTKFARRSHLYGDGRPPPPPPPPPTDPPIASA
jgi:NADH dehydrogenase